MRLALVFVLSVVVSGCAVTRADREESVEGPAERRAKAEPVLLPSEALKPKSLEIASPVSDHFYMRGTYFPATVETLFRVDPAFNVQGTTLSGEEDLGFDDRVDQGRMEFDIRLVRRHHVRIDYFKLNRFSEQNLGRNITFGDFNFAQGERFRAKFDWRVLSLTHTYSFLHLERFELGLGLGFHLIETQAEGGVPGTLRRIEESEVGIFPTIALNSAFRISKRWAVTARGQYFSATPQNYDGTMAEYHMDLQYRWRKNFAIGLGYTILQSQLYIEDEDQPLLFDLDTSGPEIFFRVSF
jgi:hypothetical protein